jgi:O-antigen/teichoic acid export membrane protein
VSFFHPLIGRVKGSPLINRLVHGAFWSVAGAVMARGLGLATWMVVARLVGKEVFGELGILQTTFGFLQNLSLFGLGIMATKYVAQYKASDGERAGRIIGMSVLLAATTGALMGAALWVYAPWVAEHVLAAPHLAGVLRIGSVLVLICSIGGALEGALAGFEAFKTMAGLGLVTGLISLPLYAWAAWQGGLEGVVWVMVATSFMSLGLNYAVLRRATVRNSCPISFRSGRRELKAFFDFSLPVFLSTQTYFAADWLGNWLLVRQPSGYAQLGIFTAATRWQQAVSFIPLYVRRAVFPGLTDCYSAEDYRSFNRMLKYYVILSTGIALACAAVLSAASRLVMSGYGPGFAEGWPVLVVVSLTMILLPFRWTLEMIYRSTGAVWYELVLNLAWTAIMLTCMFTLQFESALRLSVSIMIAFLATNLLGAAHVYFRYYRRQAVMPRNS